MFANQCLLMGMEKPSDRSIHIQYLIYTVFNSHISISVIAARQCHSNASPLEASTAKQTKDNIARPFVT